MRQNCPEGPALFHFHGKVREGGDMIRNVPGMDEFKPKEDYKYIFEY